jgi:ABC-type transport system involved in multi-copper enzyme maturation permease subunit
MTAIRDLARWEWFKLRGRRVIWVLLGAVVAFAATTVVLRFGDYQFQKDRAIIDEVLFKPELPLPAEEVDVDCRAFLAGSRPTEYPPGFGVEDIDVELTSRECTKEIAEVTRRLERHATEFTLPGTVPWALRWTQLVSIPVAALLTVLVVGSEFTWGTLRTMLMRGAGRGRILLVKLGFVATALAATWIAALLAVVVASALVTPFAPGVGHGDWAMGTAVEIAGDTARAWASCLPYVALASLLAVGFGAWSGGTMAASALAAGAYFGELFTMGRLIGLFSGASGFSWFGTVADYDLGWNTAALVFGRGGEPVPGFALAGAIGATDYPTEAHALIVMTAWFALFTAAAVVILRRRDVGGPAG